MGIIHKLMRKLRGSDVAVVSDESAGQHNRTGSQGPLDWQFGEERAWCRPGESPDYGKH